MNFTILDKNFYYKEITKHNLSAQLNLSEEKIKDVFSDTIDYFKNDKEYIVNINLKDDIYFYNQKEILHLKEVKDLFTSYNYFNFMVLIVGFISFLGMSKRIKDLANALKNCLIIFITIITCIVLSIITNFERFWIFFHHLFFRSDLWLLDPNKSRLINLTPEGLFFDLVKLVLIRYVLVIALFAIIIFIINYIKNKKNEAKIHIVLYEPEIPANTGNIMRTAMAFGAKLHLIEPLGFELSEKTLKRAAMDYLLALDYEIHPSYDEFLKKNNSGYFIFLTRYAKKDLGKLKLKHKINQDIYLIFGKESTGIPKELLVSNLNNCYRIPMVKDARSLNLSNCVALVIYTISKELDFNNLSLYEHIKGKDFLIRE